MVTSAGEWRSMVVLTVAVKANGTGRAPAGAVSRHARQPAVAGPATVPALQRSAGNQAVAALLGRSVQRSCGPACDCAPCSAGNDRETYPDVQRLVSVSRSPRTQQTDRTLQRFLDQSVDKVDDDGDQLFLSAVLNGLRYDPRRFADLLVAKPNGAAEGAAGRGGGPRVEPVPVEPPQRAKERACRDVCGASLPIVWPAELPLPGGRGLERVSRSDDDWFSPRRGSAQARLADQIRRAREQTKAGVPTPPPRPCFADDADPYELYHAHHRHPLFLGGWEDPTNLCALKDSRHHTGHRLLTNQILMYMTDSTWRSCRMCSSMLTKHGVGQQYEIDRSPWPF